MKDQELPCPYRILDYAGGGLVCGAFGLPYYAFRGARWSPPGHELTGAVTLAKSRGVSLIGGFAIWGAVAGVFECTIESVRGTDDCWNRVLAVGATRGTFAIRAGARPALLRTVEGLAMFAFIELIGMEFDRYFAAARDQNIPMDDPKDERLQDDETPPEDARVESPDEIAGVQKTDGNRQTAPTRPWLRPKGEEASTVHETGVFSQTHPWVRGDDESKDNPPPVETPLETRIAPKTSVMGQTPSARPWLAALAVGVAATTAGTYIHRYPLASRAISKSSTRR